LVLNRPGIRHTHILWQISDLYIEMYNRSLKGFNTFSLMNFAIILWFVTIGLISATNTKTVARLLSLLNAILFSEQFRNASKKKCYYLLVTGYMYILRYRLEICRNMYVICTADFGFVQHQMYIHLDVYTLQCSYKALRTILGTEMNIKISTYIRNRIFRNNWYQISWKS